MLFATLPNPSSPSFPAIASILMGFAGTSYGFWRQMPRDEIQWVSFFWAYIGVALGLVLYMELCSASYSDDMKRNVLATELHLPIALGTIIGIPILEVWLWLDWSRGALGLVEIGVIFLAISIGKPVQAWLAPRIGIPPPRQIARKHKA